ncbi:MAG TPA: hypothetical protein PL033_17795 [Candidatus Brocadiia bacterium]|nr:hypothetical protein [Candidatus Brocadiia bacterium]
MEAPRTNGPAPADNPNGSPIPIQETPTDGDSSVQMVALALAAGVLVLASTAAYLGWIAKAEQHPFTGSVAENLSIEEETSR